MTKALACVVAAAALLTSCVGDGNDAPDPAADSPPADSPLGDPGLTDEEEDHAEIYAAVIIRLVTRDHTFGGGDSPFGRVYVIDGVIDGAGDPERAAFGRAGERFEPAMIDAITENIEGLPPTEFIRDPDAARVGPDGMGGVKGDGVIISLGPIQSTDGEVHVPNGLWCGGLCGQWMTYVVEERRGRWRVTGTTGPIAIS